MTSSVFMETTTNYSSAHNVFTNNNNSNIYSDRNDIRRLKSGLTLDINNSGNGIDLCGIGLLEEGLLSTPDVGMLKLATPELEQLVLHQYFQQQQQERAATVCLEQPQASRQPAERVDENCPSSSSSIRLSAAVTNASFVANVDSCQNSDSVFRDCLTFANVTSQSQLHHSESLLHRSGDVEDGHAVGLATRAITPMTDVHLGSPAFVSVAAKVQQYSSVHSMPRPARSETTSFASSYSPQNSLSSSSFGAFRTSLTPPPSKSVRKKTRMPTDNDPCTSSPYGDLIVDDVTFNSWCPTPSSLLKRRYEHAFVNDHNVSVSLTSGRMTSADCVVETPPMSPIDMVDQERMKLEQKRARNRLAATRCRNRKLDRIATLQGQAERLRVINTRLVTQVSRLRDNVDRLRCDIARHSATGCPTLASSYQMSATASILQQRHPDNPFNMTSASSSGHVF